MFIGSESCNQPPRQTLKHQRDLIDQAAELLGKTRSEFMLETVCREAEAVSFEKFQTLLDAHPLENPRLRQLMATKAPWES